MSAGGRLEYSLSWDSGFYTILECEVFAWGICRSVQVRRCAFVPARVVPCRASKNHIVLGARLVLSPTPDVGERKVVAGRGDSEDFAWRGGPRSTASVPAVECRDARRGVEALGVGAEKDLWNWCDETY